VGAGGGPILKDDAVRSTTMVHGWLACANNNERGEEQPSAKPSMWHHSVAHCGACFDGHDIQAPSFSGPCMVESDACQHACVVMLKCYCEREALFIRAN
jgi:hypothetical protein